MSNLNLAIQIINRELAQRYLANSKKNNLNYDIIDDEIKSLNKALDILTKESENTYCNPCVYNKITHNRIEYLYSDSSLTKLKEFLLKKKRSGGLAEWDCKHHQEVLDKIYEIENE
jgi:hypothetical protein